eukprot:PhF_6_TR29303/c0_g1_i1/m.42967
MSSDDDAKSPSSANLARAMSVKFESEEYYAARHSGWLPFTIKPNGAVHVLDATTDPTPGDEAPRTVPLCAGCSEYISKNPYRYTIDVDRHYKPMMLSNSVKDGWLEKLGGDMISNWKRRWFMVTEKGLHYFEAPPEQNEKKKKPKGSKAFLLSGVLNCTLIDNPDPIQYKNCKDSNFFYFGLQFNSPNHVFMMRTTNPMEKAAWVKFFQDVFKRLSQSAGGGTQHDPPYWKAAVDSLLQRFGEEKEYLTDVKLKKEAYESKLVELRDKLAALKAQREGKRQGLTEKQKAVSIKLGEVRAIQGQIDDVKRKSKLVEEDVAKSQREVEELRKRLEKDVEYARELEDGAVLALSKTRAALDKIRNETEELRRMRDSHFNQWRKTEEHWKDKKKEGPRYSFGLGTGWAGDGTMSDMSAPLSPTIRLQLPARAMAHEVSIKHVPSVHWKSSRSNKSADERSAS